MRGCSSRTPPHGSSAFWPDGAAPPAIATASTQAPAATGPIQGFITRAFYPRDRAADECSDAVIRTGGVTLPLRLPGVAGAAARKSREITLAACNHYRVHCVPTTSRQARKLE